MYRKKIALALALLLGAASFSACGEAAAPSSSAGSAAPVESTVESDGRELSGNLYKTGLPLVKEKESFSLLIDGGDKAEEIEIFRKIEEETNVEIDWMSYPYDIAAEKKNLMYSSGDYPDVVAGWLLSDLDITKYGLNEGIYIPLDDYIAGYAPRMTEVLDSFPDARQTLTTPDGHIYTIALMAPQPLTGYVVHINQTWLDQLKLSIPKNTDDYYAALKAFKENDMNGNGDASDEIPLSLRGQDIGNLFGWFGQPDKRGEHIALENGQPIFVPATEGFKEAVKYMAKLYGEGLLDVETFTQDGNQFSAKGKEEDVIYGSFFDWSGANTVGMDRYVEHYEALPVLSSPSCSEPTWLQGDGWVFKNQMAVTKNAKNPATIIRFMDYVYDEDNSIQIKYGAYGNLFTRSEDGTLNEVPIPEGETLDSIRGRESIPSFPYAIFPEVNDLFPKTQEDINKAHIDEVYQDGIVREKMPAYWMTAEESAEISTVATDIDKYVEDQKALWISGEADIEEDWQSFQDQLKLLGLEKYMEIKSKAILRSLGN